jgi:hypothetical protein
MKFGTVPKDLITEIQDQRVLQAALQREINEIGIRFLYTENRALFAVQSLLDANNYPPVLQVQVTDYLEAFGVTKSKSRRNRMEYHSASRQAALEALLRLGEISHLIAFNKTERMGKKAVKSRKEYITPLVQVTQNQNELVIIPAPIVTDQIDTYFCWLPKDLYQICGSDYAKVLFLEYLNYHYDNERKKRSHASFTLRYQRETWAYKFRMDSFIRNRQQGRIKDKITELFEFGKSLDLISEYELDQPGRTVDRLDVIKLNTDTFKAARSTYDSSNVSLSETQSLPIPDAEASNIVNI